MKSKKILKNTVFLPLTLAIAVGQCPLPVFATQQTSKPTSTQEPPSHNISLNNSVDRKSLNEFMHKQFEEFKKIQKHTDEFFNQIFAEFNAHPSFEKNLNEIFNNSVISNDFNLDLKDDKDKFTVTLKLPKANNKVDVKLVDQILTLFGEVEEKVRESGTNAKTVKEYSSSFIRSLKLPSKVKANSLTSTVTDDKVVVTILKDT